MCESCHSTGDIGNKDGVKLPPNFGKKKIGVATSPTALQLGRSGSGLNEYTENVEKISDVEVTVRDLELLSLTLTDRVDYLLKRLLPVIGYSFTEPLKEETNENDVKRGRCQLATELRKTIEVLTEVDKKLVEIMNNLQL